MTILRLKARDKGRPRRDTPTIIRRSAVRRRTWLLLALALVWMVLGSNLLSVVKTASDDGSFGAAPKPMVATPLSPNAPAGKIAFQSNRDDGIGEIYVMNDDGTNQVRLTGEPSEDSMPAFAPSGSKIAFYSCRDDPQGEIYLMNDDGTNQVRLTNDPAANHSPVFAPLVSKIAFTSDRNGASDIYIMNDDGTNQVRLTNNPTADFDPAFSALGDKIVFASAREGASDIFVMNSDGTNQVRLTNHPAFDSDPAFSPVGNKIVFVSDRDGNPEIYVMNADGTNQVRLTNNPDESEEPVFSPDGTKIAFTSDRIHSYEVYVMNTDGSNLTRLTQNFATDRGPSWAPGSVVSLAVNDVSLAEGNSGTSALTFTVTKTGPTTENVTVRVNTANSIATAPGDYLPIVNQQLTFLPTETTKTVTVTVNGDTTIEPNETLFVDLTAATNAFIGDAHGIGTILNDDFVPLRNLPNLLQLVIFEQTNGPTPNLIPFAPDALQLRERRPDPLTDANRDFSFANEEYYDAFYSNADGTPNPDGLFITIEGVWRDLGLTARQFGGMNINEVELRFQNGTTDRADFVSSFVYGSICNPGSFPEQCIPGSESRAVDNNVNTFPRFGHTSNTNVNERFRLTVGFNGIPPQAQGTVQFGSPTYNAAEGTQGQARTVSVTVNRSGDTTVPTSVDYRTIDTDTFTIGCFDTVNNLGGAFGRCDFATTVGNLQFAAGETSKTISIPIIDDAFAESVETFQVRLENPVGATIGMQGSTMVTIQDNDLTTGPNPIFQSPFFVGQQYLDVLSREAEPAGFNAWVTLLNGCPDVFNVDPNAPSAGCDRILVANSFFGSVEFRLKAFYAFRFYRVAHNRLPEYPEIISDMSFVAGATAQEVFQRKALLGTNFTQRQEFLNAYGSLSNAGYVNALLSRYQLTQITTPDPQQPDATTKVTLTAADLTNQLNSSALSKAQVFRAVVDSDQVLAAELNNSIVAMQYYVYLRRKPEPSGFQAWLLILQRGDYRSVINGFINSPECRLRFGPA